MQACILAVVHEVPALDLGDGARHGIVLLEVEEVADILLIARVDGRPALQICRGRSLKKKEGRSLGVDRPGASG